ncbi:MAG: hypothetical protein RLZZ450_4092 [Pseudomonadota bacterium]|jgi:hypothetical protein
MDKPLRSLWAPTLALTALFGACADEQTPDREDDEQQPEGLGDELETPFLLADVQVDPGEKVTLLATRDTSVRSSTPNTNEGKLKQLSGSRSLVAIDNVTLRAALGPTDVLLGANLKLTPPPSGQPRNTRLGVYRATQTWTELGATWNCAIDSNPANNSKDCSGATAWSMDLNPPNPWFSTATAQVSLTRGSTKVVSVDVTSDVKRFLASPLPTTSTVDTVNGIKAATNEGWVLLSSANIIGPVTTNEAVAVDSEESRFGPVDGANAVFQSREGEAPPTLVLSIRRCNATLCDDNNACTVDSCNTQGACIHTAAPSGTACSDGDACTVGEQCTNSVCVPGDVVACGVNAKVVVNEVESSGGVPGDWIELFNAGTHPVDVSSWALRDNDDMHNFAIAAGSVIAPGSYLVVDEASLAFGLGGADAARLFDASATLIDSYSWAAHAAVTYGRCPNGTGAFANTASSTKGTANVCGTPACTPGTLGCSVVLNEVESSSGVPGDWIELYNQAAAPIDVSGWIVKDNDDAHSYTLPASSIVPPGGFLIVEEAALGFGLGSADSARLFTPSAVLSDTYSWTAHAPITYGRCPDGSGPFASTTASTKGAANNCTPTGPTFTPWPGGSSVVEVDAASTFAGNLSGLSYDPPSGATAAVLWGVVNGPSLLHRLTFDGTVWLPTAADGWQAGKTLLYPSGTGSPDAEGVSRAELGSPAIYVATERDNDNSGVSRMSILRYDTSAAGTSLVATREWNLTADLPVSGANAGMEAIAWVPDSELTGAGFRDARTNALYDPTLYENHGTGLFFVGLESGSSIYAYALDHVAGTFLRVATVASGQPLVVDLSYDRDVGQLWAYCDDACGNRGTILAVQENPSSPDFGKLAVRAAYERPVGMANLANEGIALGGEGECAAGQKPFFWADDADTGGVSIRRGSVTCGPLP